MKRRKQLILLLIILSMIIGVCGCMSTDKSNKAEKMKDLALEYLNENYDDTFTAEGYSDGDWAYDYSTVNFSSEKYSGTVEVRIYEEDGTYSFKDDYFKLTMEEDAEKYFEAFVSKYGYTVEVKVRFISLGVDDIDANAHFTDYAATGKCNMEVYFIAGTNFAENDIESVLADLCNAKIMGNFRFVVTNDSDLLAQYSISEIVNEKSDSVLEKQSYSINSSFEVVN